MGMITLDDISQKGLIRSVSRAVTILMLFKDHDELGIANISKMLGIPKGTVHALVKTLAHHDFLEKNESTQKYRCGLEAFQLGMSFARRMDLRRIAAAELEKLCYKVDETVHMAVLVNGMCVNVDRFSPNKPFLLIPQTGSAIPAHCTATGKVLLSQLSEDQLNAVIEKCGLVKYTEYTIDNINTLKTHLKQVREDGYAISDQEAIIGLTCIAVPIRDNSGSIVAAISIASDTQSVANDNKKNDYIQMISETAVKISSYLGYNSQ